MNNVKKIVKEYNGEVWTKAIGSAYDKIKKDVTVDGLEKEWFLLICSLAKTG